MQKTEDPTPKRLREAREEGNVARSGEFTGVVVMLAALGVLVFWISATVRELVEVVHLAIDLATRPDLETRMLGPYLLEGLRRIGWILFPLLGASFLVAAFVSFVQVGPLFAPSVLLPDGDKFDPISGFAELFTRDKLVELGKNAVKIAIMSWIGYAVLASNVEAVLRVPRVDLSHGIRLFESIALELGMFLVTGLVAFGIFDLWWTRKRWWNEMKMTKKEVEDEHKELEGDPEIERKREEKHKELVEEAQQTTAVREADAVVTNPSHVAVALQYEEKRMEAPHVVARGKGPRARKIKRMARRYQIPMVRDVDLARSLHDCEIDSPIPPDFYEPVAEVLSFVHDLRDSS